MKATSFIFKVAAIVLTAAALVCCILANLERITDGLLTLREQVAAKRNAYRCPCDADDYEEWDV